MPEFDSNGVSIHYEVFGDEDKAPIVLVHGFAASLDANWVRPGWIKTLTPLRQVVALDCRGHGESERPYDAESYGDNMADDVIRLMDHLNIDKSDLFGYSMGARISTRLMTTRPERFHSVVLGGIGNVLLAAPKGGRPHLADAMLANDKSDVEDPIAKGFRIFAEATGADLKALAASTAGTWTPLSAGDLSKVDLPVLIVVGEQDTLVGSADELQASIPGAELLKISDREHLTVVPDQRFKEAVVRFLKERSPA